MFKISHANLNYVENMFKICANFLGSIGACCLKLTLVRCGARRHSIQFMMLTTSSQRTLAEGLKFNPLWTAIQALHQTKKRTNLQTPMEGFSTCCWGAEESIDTTSIIPSIKKCLPLFDRDVFAPIARDPGPGARCREPGALLSFLSFA